MNIAADAFEKQVCMTAYRPDVETRSESSDTDNEDGSKLDTPGEVTPKIVISDFNNDRLFEDGDKDEQPDTIDMSD